MKVSLSWLKDYIDIRMDAADLALVFEPHATSKICVSDDLAGIRTMGFRGEALASIGSVAKVKNTRTPKGGGRV